MINKSLHSLSTTQLLAYQVVKKSTGTAYILWALLGIYGIQYFYLGGAENKQRGIRIVIRTILLWAIVSIVLLVTIDSFLPTYDAALTDHHSAVDSSVTWIFRVYAILIGPIVAYIASIIDVFWLDKRIRTCNEKILDTIQK